MWRVHWFLTLFIWNKKKRLDFIFYFWWKTFTCCFWLIFKHVSLVNCFLKENQNCKKRLRTKKKAKKESEKENLIQFSTILLLKENSIFSSFDRLKSFLMEMFIRELFFESQRQSFFLLFSISMIKFSFLFVSIFFVAAFSTVLENQLILNYCFLIKKLT